MLIRKFKLILTILLLFESSITHGRSKNKVGILKKVYTQTKKEFFN